MKEKIKYALYPGIIQSKSPDKQFHSISAYDLARLYKVNINECITIIPGIGSNHSPKFIARLIPLYPRHDIKNYIIPTERKHPFITTFDLQAAVYGEPPPCAECGQWEKDPIHRR